MGCFYKIVWVLSPHSFTKCPHGFHQLERKMTSWLWHELKNTHTVENGTSALFRLGCLSFVSSSCLLTLSSAVFVTSEITTRKLGHPCVHTIARTCPSSPQKDRASQVLFHALWVSQKSVSSCGNQMERNTLRFPTILDSWDVRLSFGSPCRLEIKRALSPQAFPPTGNFHLS